MTGHLTREELEGFRRHTIDPQKLLRADRHLAGCEQCQRELRSAVPAPAAPGLVKECEEPLHPSYEQITAFIDADQSPAEREWVERHVQCCFQCAAEVAELKAFDAHLIVPQRVPESPAVSWLQWLSGFFAAPERPRFVAASVCALLLGFLAMAQLKVGTLTGIESQTILEDAVRSNPGQFYGGAVLVAIGLAGVLYRISRKK